MRHFERVLVVAAHPDDELLGCGGSIARMVGQGSVVSVLIVGEGITSRRGEAAGALNDQLAALAASTRRACGILGVSSVDMLGLPDNRLDTLPQLDINQAVEAVVERVRPDLVMTHHHGNLNVDHRRVHEAVVTATRPMPGGLDTAQLFFETVSSTEWQTPGRAPFLPSYFVDISATLERKIEALACYETEMRDWPHARSLEAVRALARWRGASVGRAAAEAFAVGRIVQS